MKENQKTFIRFNGNNIPAKAGNVYLVTYKKGGEIETIVNKRTGEVIPENTQTYRRIRKGHPKYVLETAEAKEIHDRKKNKK